MIGGQFPFLRSSMTETADSTSKAENDIKKGLLLVVFVHGFKGSDNTFGQFPQRLQHVLTETVHDLNVECVLFPAYETKGDLNEAVERFADWLTELTVKREVEIGLGARSAKIALCGHSMGGLLVADTLLEFINTRADKDCPLWPNIVACITFDTPYLGIHPHVFKNSVTQVAGYADAAKTVGSAIWGAFSGTGASSTSSAVTGPIGAADPAAAAGSGWAKWAPAAYAVGGALLAGAAAGGAYYKRADLTTGWTWATDHMKYVGNLWDEDALKRRIAGLVKAEKESKILVRVFYTYIPPIPPFAEARTFVVLPKPTAPERGYFIEANNGIAPDELQAHTGMFGARTNDGYYNLGFETAKLIREAVSSDVETWSTKESPEDRKGQEESLIDL